MIEEYSLTDDLIRKWTTGNRQMSPFNLSSATEKIKLLVCQNLHKNFTIVRIKFSFLYVCYLVVIFQILGKMIVFIITFE